MEATPHPLRLWTIPTNSVQVSASLHALSYPAKVPAGSAPAKNRHHACSRSTASAPVLTSGRRAPRSIWSINEVSRSSAGPFSGDQLRTMEKGAARPATIQPSGQHHTLHCVHLPVSPLNPSLWEGDPCPCTSCVIAFLSPVVAGRLSRGFDFCSWYAQSNTTRPADSPVTRNFA